jgi:hypothetical protein
MHGDWGVKIVRRGISPRFRPSLGTYPRHWARFHGCHVSPCVMFTSQTYMIQAWQVVTNAAFPITRYLDSSREATISAKGRGNQVYATWPPPHSYPFQPPRDQRVTCGHIFWSSFNSPRPYCGFSPCGRLSTCNVHRPAPVAARLGHAFSMCSAQSISNHVPLRQRPRKSSSSSGSSCSRLLCHPTP